MIAALLVSMLYSPLFYSSQSFVPFACLSPFQLCLFFAPTTLYTLLFPLFSVHWSPRTALYLHLVPKVSSPLLPLTSTSRPTHPLPSRLQRGQRSTDSTKACCQPSACSSCPVKPVPLRGKVALGTKSHCAARHKAAATGWSAASKSLWRTQLV